MPTRQEMLDKINMKIARTGYIKYGDSDVTACEVLLSNNK